jgi:hypothetical protein
MKPGVKSTLPLVVCILVLAGCRTFSRTPVPQAPTPAVAARIVRAPFDKTWTCALRAATDAGGTVITADETSGCFVCSYPWQEGRELFYMSVLMRPVADGLSVNVHYFPQVPLALTNAHPFWDLFEASVIMSKSSPK